VTAPLVGREEPRLWTPSLRPLTPETSLGFACVRFADEVLRVELDAWQQWFLVHALEVNPDDSFRFRTLLLLVARQNGKTTVMRVLTLWALWTGLVRLAVGTAQDLDVARECWLEAANMAQDSLADDLEGKPRRANGQEALEFRNGSRYKIKATTEDAARGIPGVGLLLADELRTHRDYKAWGAMSKTAMAVPNALIVGMSNAGDDHSIVLNDLRERALAGANPDLGIFEWSAAEGCALDDPAAWAQANPSLGHGRLTERAIRSAMLDDPPEVFRTEVLCQRVTSLDTAIDADAWKGSRDPSATLGIRAGETPEAFAERRKTMRLSACVDVAPDGAHVTLAIAALEPDGRVRVEVAAAWKSTQEARAQLPAVLRALKPAATAWFPSGPAAALAPVLRPLAGEHGGLTGAKVAEVCMHLADLVRARRVLHSGDPLLDAHVGGASRLHSGDGWRFTRSGAGHCDAAYAAAGAVYLAITSHKAPRRIVVL
jgi:hypothetical protein